MEPSQPGTYFHTICQAEESFEGNAELLVYLVDEEEDIYMRSSLCHLGHVQLKGFSCTEIADLYEYTPPPQHRHSH
jgi:hypothetical protein